MTITSLLAMAFAIAAGPQAGDGGLDGSHFGAGETPQTVYVTAESATASAPLRSFSSTTPPHYCSFELDPGVGAPPPTQTGKAGGAWYRWRCDSVADQQNLEAIPKNDLETWVPKSPSTPGDVAQQAVKEIHLPQPAMHLSPGSNSPQWVNFPAFLWTDAAAWNPLSATASAGGVAVSATATPVRLTWDMGDGATVTCTGPGTPFTDETPAAASSPDCGYMYHRASDTEPSGKFTIQATETWQVTWAGGGQSGTLPDLAATSSIAVRVAESQALVSSVR